MPGNSQGGSTGSDPNGAEIDAGTLTLTGTPTPISTGLSSSVSSRSVRLRFPVLETTTRLAAAPTTLGDYIRASGSMSTATLIHELTHVWQYQHGGAAYISDSICHQVAAWAATGSRNAAYDLTDVVRPGKSFSEYTAEQQAMIVETYYDEPDKRTDPVYQALIDQVRRRSPAPPAERQRLIYEEGLFGPTNDLRRDVLPDERRPLPIMPLIRIDF